MRETESCWRPSIEYSCLVARATHRWRCEMTLSNPLSVYLSVATQIKTESKIAQKWIPLTVCDEFCAQEAYAQNEWRSMGFQAVFLAKFE